MTIQWQASSVQALTSQLYMLQCINKERPSTCCLAAKNPNHSKLRSQTCEETKGLFNGADVDK